jgi:hypothetical protein
VTLITDLLKALNFVFERMLSAVDAGNALCGSRSLTFGEVECYENASSSSLKAPYPRKHIQARLTVAAAAKAPAGQKRSKSEIGRVGATTACASPTMIVVLCYC